MKQKKEFHIQKWKNIFLIYFFVLILFTIIYFVLFRSPLFASQRVLFYRGILLLVFTILISFFTMLIFYAICFKSNCESFVAAIVLSASIHLSLFVIFPVTFERSLTMYLLSTLNQNPYNNYCQGLTKSQLTEQLIDEYILKKDAARKRINEQKIINFLTEKEDCIQLTKKGSAFLKLSNMVKKIYGIDEK